MPVAIRHQHQHRTKHRLPPLAMAGSSRRADAPVAEYDLRQASADRWQLMEPLPVARDALEAELQRLDAKLVSLADESDAEFLLGCELLSQRKQQQQEQSHARFDRATASLAMLFAHECDQVNARYAERCEQLKQDMSEELQREIRRLKYTRDGVSVMDRRRLMRRSVGGGSGGNSASASGSASLGTPSSSQGGGEDASSQDPYYSAVSTTAAQLAEKKRMDVLLSATPIFQRLNKTLEDEQVSRDLEMIKETMPSLLMEGDADLTGAEDNEEQEKREMEMVRKQMSPSGGAFKRRRLAYDPRHIPEGQAVVVYKKMPGSARKKPQKAKKHHQGEDDDLSVSPTDKKVAAGVVTAKTATQLFLLTDRGVFETVDLSDWKSGRVSIRTAA